MEEGKDELLRKRDDAEVLNLPLHKMQEIQYNCKSLGAVNFSLLVDESLC